MSGPTIPTWQERIRATGLPNDRWNWRRVQAAHRAEIKDLREYIAAVAQCKWPNCLPEQEQQALAAQVHGELYSGAPAKTPKLKKYKQTWDSTSNLVEREDGDYYRVADVDALLATQAAPVQPAPCTTPPEGWNCTRGDGHEGPCAALPETQSLSFADHIINGVFEGGDFDGGYLQSLAVTHGLLTEVEATEPCGENCACARDCGMWPVTCYRKTYDVPNNKENHEPDPQQ